MLAKKGRPYSDVKDFIEVEKAHGVKYSVGYNNNKQCEQSVQYISETLFNLETKEKLKRCNFVTVLCDSSTDSAVIEKECITLFVDPDTFEPKLTFFSLEDAPSQDADGLISAIETAFKKHGLEEVLRKMVFLCSDGASVNSGLIGGVAAKFQNKDLTWLVFVWCISHRLELALQDSLEETLSPVKNTLTNLFYLYKKSSKKTSRVASAIRRVEGSVRLRRWASETGANSQGTRWIAHLIHSMTGFIDKFAVYLQHIENVIADTSKKCDHTTLEGKRRQLINAEVLLKCCVFVDLLQSAKNFSLASQYKATDVIMLVERIDDMKLTYQRFGKKFAKSPESVFQLPTIKKVLECITQDGDRDYVYQGIRLNYFETAKDAIANNVLEDVNAILTCIHERFGIFTVTDDDEGKVDERVDAGDKVLHDVALSITEIGSCQIIVFPMSKILLIM